MDGISISRRARGDHGKYYFDHVATNPLHPDVLEAMMPYFKEEFGNPLSVYEYGMKAKDATEAAREQVAGLVNAKPAEIIFTASGAEATSLPCGVLPWRGRTRASMFWCQGWSIIPY